MRSFYLDEQDVEQLEKAIQEDNRETGEMEKDEM